MKRLQRGLAESLTAEERLNSLNSEWENPEPGNEEALRRLKGQLLREQALQQSNNAQSVADILAARDAMIQTLEYTDNPQERIQLRHFMIPAMLTRKLFSLSSRKSVDSFSVLVRCCLYETFPGFSSRFFVFSKKTCGLCRESDYIGVETLRKT